MCHLTLVAGAPLPLVLTALCLVLYKVNFKNLNGPSQTNGARLLQSATTGADPPMLTELSKLVGEMMGAMRVLIGQVQTLSHTVNTANASKSPKPLKDGVTRPKAWTGKAGSAKARHFLAAF